MDTKGLTWKNAARSRISPGDKGLADGDGKYGGFGDSLRIARVVQLSRAMIVDLLARRTAEIYRGVSLFTIWKIYYKGNWWDIFVRFVPCARWLSRFLSHCVSGTLLMNKILLNEPLTKWLLLERRHSAFHGLLKPNLQTRPYLRTKCGRV